MSKRDTQLLLEDMHEACKKIITYTNGFTYDDFLADDKTIDAVVRNFEIIGEAAARMSEEFKITYPEIEWIKIIGFRNRIIHEYFGIDYENLWKIKEKNIPELSERVMMILQNLAP
ncbi:MAG: HepT-like ribonuclease domain-containing protein [Segetibacter sp.]